MENEQKPYRIGIFASPDYGYCREVIAGVSEVALKRNCRLRLINSNYAVESYAALELSGLIGVVGTLRNTAEMQQQNFPIINVSGRMPQSPFPQVLPDNRMTGALAAEYLLAQAVRNYACAEMGEIHFAKLRCAGFLDRLAAAGKPCTVLDAMGKEKPVQILQWAMAAPKPAALFVATDLTASVILDAFFSAGVRVPEDVLVVGVDNDTMLCQMMNPPLSSVDCNFEEVGRQAATLLLRWLDTGAAPPALTLVKPKGVVVRPSSTLSLTEDTLVNQALQVIRAQAPNRLTVKQLLNQLGVSRRTLETRFVLAGKKSPAAEILQTQIERACHLLVDTGLSLDEIAETSGLGTQRLLRAVFRRHVGESPTAYRQRYRKV